MSCAVRRKKRLRVFVTEMSLYNLFIIVRVCHEIFYLYFCNDPNPSVPLTNGFKYFFIFSLFWKIFKFLRNFAGAMCNCASHHYVNIRGVHHTFKATSVVCITSWSLSIVHGVHRTAESISAVCITHVEIESKFCLPLFAFKGTIRRNPFKG